MPPMWRVKLHNDPTSHDDVTEGNEGYKLVRDLVAAMALAMVLAAAVVVVVVVVEVVVRGGAQ